MNSYSESGILFSFCPEAKITLRRRPSSLFRTACTRNLSLMGVWPASYNEGPRERLSQKLVFLLARGRGRGLYAC